MLAVFKLLIYASGLSSLLLLLLMLVTGLWLAYDARGGSTDTPITSLHKWCFRWLWRTTLLALVTVGMFGFFLPEIKDHPPIFKIHIRYFAPEFLIALLAITLGINGDRLPRIHRWIAYPCLFCGIGTSMIGMYMAHLLPW